MPANSEHPSDRWPPAGRYPGDRRWVLWGLLGVLWILIGVTPGGGLRAWGINVYVVLGVLFAAAGIAMYVYATRTRPRVWRTVVDSLGYSANLRCVDLGSRDAVATAVVVTLRRHTSATVVATSAKVATLAGSNMAAVGAGDDVTVVTASLWELPLDDGCADLIVADGADQLVRPRAQFGRVMAEVVRVGAPGASVALVVVGRARAISDALAAAGATDISITRVPMSWWSGYRLVRATLA